MPGFSTVLLSLNLFFGLPGISFVGKKELLCSQSSSHCEFSFIGSVRHSVFVLSAVAAVNFFGARLRATPFLFGGKCSDV